jgi:hypothetical protein
MGGKLKRTARAALRRPSATRPALCPWRDRLVDAAAWIAALAETALDRVESYNRRRVEADKVPVDVAFLRETLRLWLLEAEAAAADGDKEASHGG